MASGTLTIVNARLVDVLAGAVQETSLQIQGGIVTRVGGGLHQTTESGSPLLDARGQFLVPGLIDAHIHVESSLLTPEGFAEAAVPHGVLATVSDPHEIANVGGAQAFALMNQASQGLPMHIFWGLPSCVPSSPWETSGARLDADDLEKLWEAFPQTRYLSEVMNYPGVIHRDPLVMGKIKGAQKRGKIIDGHAPTVRGSDLDKYLAAGIQTDHECVSADEATEKVSKGMAVLIREGSAARNFAKVFPAVNDQNFEKFAFCTDDTHADLLVKTGTVNRCVRQAISLGMDPVKAIQLATINPARIYKLDHLGAIAVGREANFFLTEDLQKLMPSSVYFQGTLVAQQGRLLKNLPRANYKTLLESVFLPAQVQLNPPRLPAIVPVIECLEGELITNRRDVAREVVQSNPQKYNFLAVLERHGKNGNIGYGRCLGLGLKQLSLASTVAHDHHNLIVAGDCWEDMQLACQRVRQLGGGLVAVANKKVLAELPLPVGGLMSLESPHFVAEQLEKFDQVFADKKTSVTNPLMTLSFLALPVIPHLKLTDLGLIDVDGFNPLSLGPD